jgi:hypothetical protein
MRQKSKKNGELAHIFVSGLLEECTRRDEEKNDIELKMEMAIR